jgi:hypothetical protein
MTTCPDLRKQARIGGLPTMTSQFTANGLQRADLWKHQTSRGPLQHLPTMTRSTR